MLFTTIKKWKKIPSLCYSSYISSVQQSHVISVLYHIRHTDYRKFLSLQWVWLHSPALELYFILCSNIVFYLHMLFYKPDVTDVHDRFLVILSTYWLLLFISPLTQALNIVSTQISIFYLPQRLPNSAKKNKHRNKQKRTKLCGLGYYKFIIPAIIRSVFEIPGIMVPSSPSP